MDLPPRDSFDSLTDTSTTGYEDKPSSWQPQLIPGLVIVAHPDPGRIGDEAPLFELTAGRPARLSRHEPTFLPPGSPAAPKPLGDASLSRKAMTFVAGPRPGELTLRRGDSATPLRCGGVPLDEEMTFRPEQLDNGVVLVLAGRVALLLCRLPLAPPPAGPDCGLLGHSPAIVRLRREIRSAALLEVPILVRGETGSGKELVSQAVHEARPRRGPYVAVNLGALVPALAAAELFGATRGAYTGADHPREGSFRRADGGTLFLDEIGEAPLEVQVMLLRTLETRKVQPLGAAAETPVDVRVIAATDADLEAAIAAGRFRSALLHRLAGYEIRVPPLRERRDDIARLLVLFLDEESRALGARRDGEGSWPAAADLARLVEHDWPGNVRELKNVARRLAVLRHIEGQIDPSPLLDQLLRPKAGPAAPRAGAGAEEEGQPARRGDDIGRDELIAALEENDWQPGPTAKKLGLSRPALYRLIEAHPELRTAAELSLAELQAAIAEHGSVAAAARALKVSPQGLRRRLSALGGTEPT